MNRAKTLKRYLGNLRPFLECVLLSEGTSELRTRFLSAVWDTNDTLFQTSMNLTWQEIDWKRVEKNVFKLQKLIYRASSRGKIRKMHKYQKLLTNNYTYLNLHIHRDIVAV